jgi:Arc/MetJ-type ribon-helix-helix transcriptional regulator
MGISLRPETQQLIEERLKKGGYSTADDIVRVALETLDRCEADPLDDDTWQAIEIAEAQYQRGECVPWEQVRAELEAKYPPTKP